MSYQKIIFTLLCFTCQLVFPQINPDDVRESTLANGLKVLILELHEFPLVAVNMSYNVGSVHDAQEGMTGLVHFMEHMSLKGTESISAKELLDYYQKHGGVITKRTAATGKFLTSFNLSMPSNMIEFMIKFEADRMKNLSFYGFDEEKKVILSESKINESNLFEKLHSDFVARSFTDDPFRNPVIGWANDIEKITIEQVRSFYRKYYNPQNAVLCIVGDVEYEKTKELIEKYFKDIQNDDTSDVYEVNKICPFPGEIKNEIRSEGAESALEIGFRIPVDKDLQPVFDVVGAMLKNRLDRNENVKKAVINISDLAVSKIFSFIIIPQDKKYIDTLEHWICSEIESLNVEGDELENIIAKMKTGYYRKFYTNEEIAYALGKFSIIFNDWKYFFEYPELIEKATPAAIFEISKKYFVKDNRNILELY